VLASSADLGEGLEGGQPSSDGAAEDIGFCHRVNFFTQATQICHARANPFNVIHSDSKDKKVPLFLVHY